MFTRGAVSPPLLYATVGECGVSNVHNVCAIYGAPFVKILYLTDLAQKQLSLRIDSYLCTHLVISAQR